MRESFSKNARTRLPFADLLFAILIYSGSLTKYSGAPKIYILPFSSVTFDIFLELENGVTSLTLYFVVEVNFFNNAIDVWLFVGIAFKNVDIISSKCSISFTVIISSTDIVPSVKVPVLSKQIVSILDKFSSEYNS